MKNIARNIALTAVLTATVLSGAAQDLHTEVEVRYNETPQLREIDKIGMTPTISLPPERSVRMPYSTADVRVGVPGSITILEPAAYADTIYTSPYRGYAALGFMPMFNLGASAGYKLLDTDHTRLNAWMQYDGTAYKGTMMPVSPADGESKSYVRRQTATIGANLHQAVGRESFIDAGVDYTFARYNTPLFPDILYQNIHRFNASMLWALTHKDFHYGLGGEYGHFAYVDHQGYYTTSNLGENLFAYSYPTPMRENRFRFNGFFSGKFFGASSAGINVSLSHNSYGQAYQPTYSALENGLELKPLSSDRLTTLSLHPFYRFDINRFRLDLGMQIDLTFNAGKTFHIAPRAQATWIPSDFVKVYVKATGGSHANTLGSLYEVTPYAIPFQSFRNSEIPVETEVGVTIGGWHGFYAELSASYAIANNWLMPHMNSDIIDFDQSQISGRRMYTRFLSVDMKGYRLHGALGYNWKNIIDVSASVDVAPQKEKRGYYLWRDRAKTVAEARLRVTPIKPLDIDLSWEYRGDRAVSASALKVDGISTPEYTIESGMRSLGSVNNLSAGALYRITPQWSAFVRGENLMNRHSFLIGGMPAQGITGLVGATYKF